MQRVVTILHTPDCPHAALARERVLEALARIGGSSSEVRVEVVTDPEDALRRGFRGSPAVLIDGVDVFAAPESPAAFACRTYLTEVGRDGAPSVEQLVTALSVADHVPLLDRDGGVVDTASEAPKPPLHPDLAPLALLLGEWSGPGQGSYPGIEDFDYVETLQFDHSGKPFLSFSQRTIRADGGSALHVETGFLRLAGPRRVELVVAQPTGIVEVDEGDVEATGSALEIHLSSRIVGLTSSAKEVLEVERTLSVRQDVLFTKLAMAAVGHPLTHHLASALRRSPGGEKLRG